MQKQTRDLVLMLVIGILIGTSAVMVWTRTGEVRNGESDGSTAENLIVETESDTSTQSISSASAGFPLPPSIPDNTRVGLSTPDQPAGRTVTVGNLAVVGTKWVAVYDEQEGVPKWILGARRVHEGDVETVVELIRPEGTVSGHVYYTAILNDDGDDEFNRLTDLPPLSPDKVTVVRWRAK